MPLIEESSFRPSSYLPGGHLQTIVPALIRRVSQVTTQRERLELPDGDFLDLDWSGKSSTRLAIISHGLEGSSQGAYVQGMASALIHAGWDVLAWNLRGCSGETNRLKRFYHSGATEDLSAVISHAEKIHSATQIDLIGFSLGGNLTLKYLGEDVAGKIHRAVTFSVPCDLADSSAQLSRWSNAIYMRRFMKDMQRKILLKNELFPGELDLTDLMEMRSFAEFDDRYTGPIHGFQNAQTYWALNSSRPFIPQITTPTLLVSALNDPFLGEACYPLQEAAISSHFHLEMPASGGHVGFLDRSGSYWSEQRALEFLTH